MRIVVLFVAVLLIAWGVAGIIAPDSLTELRQTYMVTPRGPYAMGTSSRGYRIAPDPVGFEFPHAEDPARPRTPRLLAGTHPGSRGPFVGLDRARAILEWEAVHTGLLRIGALMALATGGFVAFTVTLRPARSDSGRAPVR